MAPFLVSFPFSLAPSLLIFIYCHSRVTTRVFFFLDPIFFWFLPSFPFLLHIFFPFLSLLLWRPFSFPFFSPFPCFFLFRPSFLAPLSDPPGCKRTLCTPQDTPLEMRPLFSKISNFDMVIFHIGIPYSMPCKGLSCMGYSFLKIHVSFLLLLSCFYSGSQVNFEKKIQVNNYKYIVAPHLTNWQQYCNNSKWRPSKGHTAICTQTCWHFSKIYPNWSFCFESVVFNHFNEYFHQR